MSVMDVINSVGPIAGAALQAGTSIYEGAMNRESVRKTNQMQIELANTAVQRRYKDLQKAGINPLLAGGQGGAQTPTLQAPQMHGIASAGEYLRPDRIQQQAQQLQKQQMEIQKTQTETEKIKADRELVLADALNKNANTDWQKLLTKLEPGKIQSLLDLQGYQGEETQARKILTEAQTQTENAMRDPKVKQALAEVAKNAQTTKTEEQRTRYETEAANNAKKYFGAHAGAAVTAADQAAQYLEKYFNRETNIRLNKEDIATQLLVNDNSLKLIELILKNKYGDAEAFANIYKTPWQLPAALAKQIEGHTKDNRVLNQDFTLRHRTQ